MGEAARNLEPQPELTMVSKSEVQTVNLSDVVFNQALYPRKTHDSNKVQEYAERLDQIEAKQRFISVSSDLTLLDGRHRHLAYLKRQDGKDCEIQVYVYPVDTEAEKYALAVELNTDHGKALSEDERRTSAIRMYSKYGYTIEEVARRVSVRKATVLEWTKVIRQDEERLQNQRIFDMWVQCFTHAEIADKVTIAESSVKSRIEELSTEKFLGTKLWKLSNFLLDVDEKGEEQPDEYGWKRPLYNVWAFSKKTNTTAHFGNSEQRIVENLLYLYTEPFDIVLDPFAGGGSTIDVCQRRLRRYWVSDRKPIVERENEIRLLDIAAELPPLNKRWSEVTLTYLDPPYWKQAEGQYSSDAEDLANMPLEQFTETLVGIVNGIAAKQSHGVIALLIQPTQWKADNREFTDHVMHLIGGVNSKRLTLENRVSCPYSTEQCNPQQVEWAKANKKLLVISRELIVWRVNG